MLILADSRRGLGGYPPVGLKMNRAELALMTGRENPTLELVKDAVAELAAQHGHRVLVTMAEQGIAGAAPDETVSHRPALPLRGEIDIVGAGDSVMANLTAALAAGATTAEAVNLAVAGSSIVIHQLGTTGTATVAQIEELMRTSGMLA